MSEIVKICKKHGELNINQVYERAGYYRCKTCMLARIAESRAKNPETIEKWRLKNKDKIKKWDREIYNRNRLRKRSAVNARQRGYYEYKILEKQHRLVKERPLAFCTKHGNLYKNDVHLGGKMNGGKQRYRCAKCMKYYVLKYYKENKLLKQIENFAYSKCPKVIARRKIIVKKYQEKNKFKLRKYHKAYWQLKQGNPEPMKLYKEKYGKKMTKQITDQQ